MLGSILASLVVVVFLLFFMAAAGAMVSMALTMIYGDNFFEEISSRIRQRQERGLPKNERVARAKDREAESAWRRGRPDHAERLWRESAEIRRKRDLQDEPL